MNKTELAKLLIKHPEIKALYESRAFDASTINKVIAEEIVREQDEEDPIEAAFGKKLQNMSNDEKGDAIRSLRVARSGLQRTLKSIMDDIKEFGEDEELTQELADTRVRAREITTLMKKIKDSTDKAIAAALKTPEIEDDKVVAAATASVAGAAVKAAMAAAEVREPLQTIKTSQDQEQVSSAISSIDAAIAKTLEKSQSAAEAADQTASAATAANDEIVDGEEAGASGNDASDQESIEPNREEIKKKVNSALVRASRSFTISSYPPELRAFLDQEDVKAGGINGDLIAVNIDQNSSKAILLCYLISRVAGKNDVRALNGFAQNGFPIMSPAPLGLAPAEYSKALGKLGFTPEDAKKIFKDANGRFTSALNALMRRNEGNKKTKFENEQKARQVVALPFFKKFRDDSQISEIITLATSEPTQQGTLTPEPEASEDPTPQPPTKRGIKIAQGAIRGQDVDTSEVTPEEVKAAIEKDKEEISSNPEMKDNAEELAQQVQTSDDVGEDASISSSEEPQQPSPEGTQAAVDAIESGDTEDVTNIDPADVQAAEEQLAPEIEADSEMKANAEELKTKVEKNKMADKLNYSGPFNGIIQKNPDKPESVVEEAQKRLEIYNKASNWEDTDLNKLHPSISKKENLPDFEQWKQSAKNYMGKKAEEFEKVVQKLNASVDDAAKQQAADELEKTIVDADSGFKALDDAINNVAGDDTSSGDVGGVDVQGKTDLETVQEILPELKDKFPNLFKFDGFVRNLAQALMNAEPSSDASGSEANSQEIEGSVDSTEGSKFNSELGNVPIDADPNTEDSDGLPEDKIEEALSGIYLAEEEGAVDDTDKAGDGKTGNPLEVADAETLKKELEALRDALKPKNINVDDLLTPELKQALGQEPTEEASEVPSVEEATEEGQNAAQDDAELRDARYQDLYAGFKEQMDTFFSLDGKNDGFMDQFLLKYQAAKLAELIGNLDLIIGGGTGGKDDEGEARALSTATQQADDNLNEAQEQEISEKGQIELKTRLVAMLKGLKSLKAMMNSYKQNATRSSANPKLDGSALKKSLQRYMSNLQINIKAIVETCYIEHSKLTQTQSDDVDLNEPSGDEATPPTGDDTNQNVEDPQPSAQNEQLYEAILEAIAPALDGVYLMEDAAREEKMEIVNTIYGQMKEEIYLPSMQSALEKAQKETAMSNASQMMELAKKEEFVALFPTFVGSFGGKPQTIDQAVDAIDGLLKEFIETMKKVIVLAKGATIDETTLAKVIEDLSMMSLMMQNYFGVKSLLDDEMQARVEKMLAQRAENQSLSDEAKPSNERSGGLMDKAKELAGKGLEKLKQLFAKLMEWLRSKDWGSVLSWFDQNKIEDVLPEGSGFELDADEVVATIKNFENEDNALGFLQDLEKSTNWYKDLGSRMQPIWDKFIKALRQGQNLQEAYNGFDVISDKLMKTEFKITEDMLNQALGKLEQAEQNMISDIIGNSYDLASSFIYHVLKGTIKLSESSDAAKPATNDLDASDDDLNDIPEPERLSSEKEMKKLINILSDSSDTKIKKVIARSKTMFEDNSERMLSLMVYYMLANSNQLRENISEQPVRPPRDAEGTNTIKKINTFLNEILKQTRLSTQIKDFIKGSRSKIVNFLKSKDVENLVQDYATGKSPLLGKLKRLVDKSIETKKIVDLETEDTTTDSDDVMSAEVEFDDEDETNDSSQEDEQDNLRAAQTSRQEWKNLGPEGLKRELSRLGASVNPDAQEDLQDAIESLSELFFDIKQAVVETKDSYSMQFDEGIKDSFKSIKGKVKSSANKFMSRFDLPKELKDDLKYLENNPSNTSGPELAERYKSNAIKFITNLKNTGVKFSGGLDVFLWTLYLNYGNIDETAKNIKVTNQNRREMDLRSQFGSEIDESNKTSRLEESLKPIIEKMLKERYNY